MSTKTKKRPLRNLGGHLSFLVPIAMFGLLFAWGFLILKNSNDRDRARSQAYSIVEKEWDNRIASKTSPEDRYMLKKIRFEVYRKRCSNNYYSDLLEARETADVDENLAAIRRQERHCLEVLMGGIEMQKNPSRLGALVKDLL